MKDWSNGNKAGFRKKHMIILIGSISGTCFLDLVLRTDG